MSINPDAFGQLFKLRERVAELESLLAARQAHTEGVMRLKEAADKAANKAEERVSELEWELENFADLAQDYAARIARLERALLAIARRAYVDGHQHAQDREIAKTVLKEDAVEGPA